MARRPNTKESLLPLAQAAAGRLAVAQQAHPELFELGASAEQLDWVATAADTGAHTVKMAMDTLLLSVAVAEQAARRLDFEVLAHAALFGTDTQAAEAAWREVVEHVVRMSNTQLRPCWTAVRARLLDELAAVAQPRQLAD